MIQPIVSQGIRLNRWIAEHSSVSRRQADALIKAGYVWLNDSVVTQLGALVSPDDKVRVDGLELAASTDEPRLWLFYKPTGVLCTTDDPAGRPRIRDHFPVEFPKFLTVGRLDFSSEGLLLLTNSGSFKRFLELPTSGFKRVYRVKLYGEVTEKGLDRLREGIQVEGFRYAPLQVERERTQGKQTWARMTLREGKNREIRKICSHLGWKVSRLIRIGYGPLELGDLQKGTWIEVNQQSLKKKFKKFFTPS